MWVFADIKSGNSWKVVDAIIADVNLPKVRSEVYPAGDSARFLSVLRAIRRVQGHPSSQDRGYTSSKSRYNCLLLHSNTKQDQNKGSNNVASTFNIRYVIRDSF